MTTEQVIGLIFKDPSVRHGLTEFDDLGQKPHEILQIYPMEVTSGKSKGKTRYYVNRAVCWLDHTYQYSGSSSMKVRYTFGKKEYTGVVIFPKIDLTRRNVFRVWVKPDGSGNRLEVFHAKLSRSQLEVRWPLQGESYALLTFLARPCCSS